MIISPIALGRHHAGGCLFGDRRPAAGIPMCQPALPGVDVRGRWQRATDTGGVRLNTAVDGMPIIAALFELADDARARSAVEEGRIDAVFSRYVQPAAGDTLAEIR